MRTSEPVPYEWWWIRVTSDNDATGGDRTEGVSVNFTTVVFDLGQVVVDWNPAKAHPDLSASEHAEIADLIDFASYNLRADAGERWSDLDAEVASLWPEHSGFLLTYARNFPAALVGEIPGTSSLIEELSALNVRLLGLTNWSSETFPHAAAAIGVLKHFEAIVVSGEVGLIKPDPAVYRYLVTAHEVVPAQAVFIDDREENVTGARRLGFHGVHFTEAAQLRADLIELGLPLAKDASTSRSHD